MAKLTINGTVVTVDDEFLNLSREEQDAVADDIAADLQARGGAAAKPESKPPSPSPVPNPIETAQRLFSGLEGGGGVSPEEEGSGQWERNVLLPRAVNTQTGEQRLAVPGIIQGTYEGIKDAVQLPGDVLQGKYADELDPARSKAELSPELIGRGLNAATVMIPAGTVPKIAAAGKRPAVEAVQQADEFGIPLTRGQTSGDLRQITKEETLRQTPSAGQPIMTNFAAKQREAIEAAAETIGSKVGANAQDMAGMVTGSIKAKAGMAHDTATSLYDIASKSGLAVKREAVESLPAFVDQRLNDAAMVIDPERHKAALQALREIQQAGDLEGAFMPAAPSAALGPTAKDDILDVSIDRIDAVRKRLVQIKGDPGSDDARVVREIKKAFDLWLDDTIDKALIHGDDAGLDALKRARREWTKFKSLTTAKTGDQAARAVVKMQNPDTTAGEVANWLYGADVVTPSLQAPKVAKKIRGIVGPNSAEWGAVRAAAWDRLVKDLGTGETRSATMIAKRLDNFINGKGSDLADVIFTKAQIEEMRAFSNALKRTITPRDATNPSRTAYTLKGMMDMAARLTAGFAGLQTGGAGLAVAGFLGVPIFKNVMSVRAASKAIRPVAPKSPGP